MPHGIWLIETTQEVKDFGEYLVCDICFTPRLSRGFSLLERVKRAHQFAWMSVFLFAIATGSSTQTGEVFGESLVSFVEVSLDV